MNRFADDIKAMFEEGQKEKGKNMSASIMRDILRQKYPLRYDVPSEYFISLVSYRLWCEKIRKLYK